MKSMTGYGRAVASLGDYQFVAEVSSVNRKSFDIAVSLPSEWQMLERDIGEAARTVAARGRINVSITARSVNSASVEWLDLKAIEAGYELIRALGEKLGTHVEADGHLLMEIAAAVRVQASIPSIDDAREPVMAALRQAIDEMASMRAREGDAIQRDFDQRVARLRGFLADIQKFSLGAVPNYRETLMKRLRQAGLEIDLDDERVLKEIAIFADRCDISEELTRLASHLDQLAEALIESQPIGRKIEFILQEIGREFNTVGGKAADSAVSRIVIEAKNELERIREQAQNVE